MERPKFSIISREEKRFWVEPILLGFMIAISVPFNHLIKAIGIYIVIMAVSYIFTWFIIKKSKWFLVTDKRLIRISHIALLYDHPLVVDRNLSDLKYYDYDMKDGKGDMFFGPYVSTKFGALLELEVGYTVGSANQYAIRDYDKFLDMTLHFFSVEHIEELINILEERTSAVKYQRK